MANYRCVQKFSSLLVACCVFAGSAQAQNDWAVIHNAAMSSSLNYVSFTATGNSRTEIRYRIEPGALNDNVWVTLRWDAYNGQLLNTWYWSPNSPPAWTHSFSRDNTGNNRTMVLRFAPSVTPYENWLVVERRVVSLTGDSDSDGTPDTLDCAPFDASNAKVIGQDTDGDGTLDCDDCFHTDANRVCQCVNEGDADGDLVCSDVDCNDNDATVTTRNDTDADGDGVNACTDCDDGNAARQTNCECFEGSGAFEDTNGDGVVDESDATGPTRGGDADGDGVCADVDCNDNDATVTQTTAVDSDGDGVGDCQDCQPLNDQVWECDCVANGLQDQDGDGVCSDVDCDDGDATNTDEGTPQWCACPVDTDMDGITDCSDCEPMDDQIPNVLPCPDADGDGIPDFCDLNPNVADPGDGSDMDPEGDCDGDGIPNQCDVQPEASCLGPPVLCDCDELIAGVACIDWALRYGCGDTEEDCLVPYPPPIPVMQVPQFVGPWRAKWDLYQDLFTHELPSAGTGFYTLDVAYGDYAEVWSVPLTPEAVADVVPEFEGPVEQVRYLLRGGALFFLVIAFGLGVVRVMGAV